MVSLQNVRANNSDLKKLGSGLVAVFVGGTAGIGATTVREFVRNTIQPTVYLVGRNEAQASKIIGELQSLNPDGKIDFLKSDISLLRNVDKACETIQGKEDSINLLFMTPGLASLKGRDETPEGLDKILNLNYYSRMRFAVNLLPQLTRAANAGRLSRVVSVLSAGSENNIFLDDLALKQHYSLRSCINHGSTMNSFAAEELAAANPGTSFIHAHPGIVKTNIAQGFGTVLKVALDVFFLTVARPWTVPLQESGERHVYAATSKSYPPLAVPDESAVVGSTGVKGSGAYLLRWDGTPCGAADVMTRYRSQDVGNQIWKHSLDVFDRVCGKGNGKY